MTSAAKNQHSYEWQKDWIGLKLVFDPTLSNINFDNESDDDGVGDDDSSLNVDLLSCLLYVCSKAFAPPSFKTGKWFIKSGLFL